MGKTPGEIFAANTRRSYFMLFAYFLFTSCIWQNSHVEALHANYYGKFEDRKKSLGKEKEKNWPKKERNSFILPKKENMFATC